MNLARAQLDAIVHALAAVLPADAPADRLLGQFFRDNKNLGGRDRALVADTVYAALPAPLPRACDAARHAAGDGSRHHREAPGRGPRADRVGPARRREG